MPSLSAQLESKLLIPLLLAILVALLLRDSTSTVPDDATTEDLCESPQTIVRIFSHDPLILHLENFLTVSEQEHLMSLSTSGLSASTIRYPNGSTGLSRMRTSSTKRLEASDPIVNCITLRAATLQGYLNQPEKIEPPRITYYEQGQQFKPHYDWTTSPEGKVTDREATIFAFIDQTCDDCGTAFPTVSVDWSKKSRLWCEFFDCGMEYLLSKPLRGSALYWRNVDSEGKGHPKTLHAGLPVSKGYKAGMNIWTKMGE